MCYCINESETFMFLLKLLTHKSSFSVDMNDKGKASDDTMDHFWHMENDVPFNFF